MLVRYLIVTEIGEGFDTDDRVRTYEDENTTINAVGRIASNDFSSQVPEELKKIYEVNLTYGRIKELNPAIENGKIVLKEESK